MSELADLIREDERTPGMDVTGETARYTAHVSNLDCPTEAAAIERGVTALDGVVRVAVHPASGRVDVEYRSAVTGEERIAGELARLGFPVREGREPAPPPPPWRNPKVLTSATSGLLLLAGWLLSLAGAPAPVFVACYVLALPVGGYFFGREALESLIVDRRVGIELLMSIAAVIALALGESAEAAMLVFLYSISEAAEGYTEEKTRGAIRALMALAPKVALVRRDGAEREVPVEGLREGDIFIVRPGESVATDGVVVAGRSAVNQAPVTGESMPADKAKDDEVFAGSVNGEGALEVRATKTFEDNTLARIIQMVEEAQERKGRGQRFIERFGNRYSPAVLAVGLVIAVLAPLLFGAEWSVWLGRATVFIVAAAPCALVISVPITFVATLGTAARHGVLIKGGVHLEDLARVRVVAMDKTGTLSQGRPEVTDIIGMNGADDGEVLRLAASVESRSEHPLGRAIVASARSRSLAIGDVQDFVSHTGAGATGTVAGVSVAVGSASMPGIPRLTKEQSARLAELRAMGKTVVLVAARGVLEGILALRDMPRPRAREVISGLHAEGYRVLMLSGDSPETVSAIARELGIDEATGGLRPEEKAERVRELSALGGVAMVGDGVNDAPALAAATVGIAMGAAGSDVALETADVALMADDLEKILYALRLAHRNRSVVRQNLLLSALVIGALVAGAVVGAFGLPVAVVGHELSELVVIASGLRMLRS